MTEHDKAYWAREGLTERQKKQIKRLQAIEQALQDFALPNASAQDVFDWLESTTDYRRNEQ